MFRGRDAVVLGVSRKQLGSLTAAGVIVRELPDTYRMTASVRSPERRLRAALLWGGEGAAASGRSAAVLYRLEGVRSVVPEIVIHRRRHLRDADVIVHRPQSVAALMVRRVRGIPATGVECTLVELAAGLSDEALEIACEDARRRRLTSVAALRSYLDRHGTSGRRGTRRLGRLLDDLDPIHAARSTLEVKARRLLVARGITGFIREFPLEWQGRTYWFDFAFPGARTILETNGRRWHDDPSDYEHDQEKWSVPGRHGYRLVFATWDKVVRRSDDLVNEVRATLHAGVDTDPTSPRRYGAGAHRKGGSS